MNDADVNQRTVLRALLDAHPRMLVLDDLRVAIPDPTAVEFAVTQLASDGLVTKLGERVGATRPAVRCRALGPIQAPKIAPRTLAPAARRH